MGNVNNISSSMPSMTVLKGDEGGKIAEIQQKTQESIGKDDQNAAEVAKRAIKKEETTQVQKKSEVFSQASIQQFTKQLGTGNGPPGGAAAFGALQQGTQGLGVHQQGTIQNTFVHNLMQAGTKGADAQTNVVKNAHAFAATLQDPGTKQALHGVQAQAANLALTDKPDAAPKMQMMAAQPFMAVVANRGTRLAALAMAADAKNPAETIPAAGKMMSSFVGPRDGKNGPRVSEQQGRLLAARMQYLSSGESPQGAKTFAKEMQKFGEGEAFNKLQTAIERNLTTAILARSKPETLGANRQAMEGMIRDPAYGQRRTGERQAALQTLSLNMRNPGQIGGAVTVMHNAVKALQEREDNQSSEGREASFNRLMGMLGTSIQGEREGNVDVKKMVGEAAHPYGQVTVDIGTLPSADVLKKAGVQSVQVAMGTSQASTLATSTLRHVAQPQATQENEPLKVNVVRSDGLGALASPDKLGEVHKEAHTQLTGVLSEMPRVQAEFNAVVYKAMRAVQGQSATLDAYAQRSPSGRDRSILLGIKYEPISADIRAKAEELRSTSQREAAVEGDAGGPWTKMHAYAQQLNANIDAVDEAGAALKKQKSAAARLGCQRKERTASDDVGVQAPYTTVSAKPTVVAGASVQSTRIASQTELRTEEPLSPGDQRAVKQLQAQFVTAQKAIQAIGERLAQLTGQSVDFGATYNPQPPAQASSESDVSTVRASQRLRGTVITRLDGVPLPSSSEMGGLLNPAAVAFAKKQAAQEGVTTKDHEKYGDRVRGRTKA